MTPEGTTTLELPKPAPVRCSDWLGRIVCGDNVEVLSCFPDACIDLVVTSPPYDDLRTYGGHSWNFEALAAQLVRVLKPGGVIVWVVADATVEGSETLTSMRQAIHFKDACGLNVETMVWEKNGISARGSNNLYLQGWEYMLVAFKGQPARGTLIRDSKNRYAGCVTKTYKYNPDGTRGNGVSRVIPELCRRTNVWRIGGGDKEDVGHPAAFPISLAADHIVSWSNPGDVVLDPFSGSGTTCKAAKELNRQWCGIEINPEYCKIAEARLSQDVLQLETCAVRPNKDYPERLSGE
jgi:site-specific DNA-methyltransferase (adenine-specific)